jgi:hypothetical protein
MAQTQIGSLLETVAAKLPWTSATESNAFRELIGAVDEELAGKGFAAAPVPQEEESELAALKAKVAALEAPAPIAPDVPQAPAVPTG